MVVLAAGVDGRLDFSFTALWGQRETSVSGRFVVLFCHSSTFTYHSGNFILTIPKPQAPVGCFSTLQKQNKTSLLALTFQTK